MRTVTAAELDVLLDAPHQRHYAKVEVQNVDAEWIDLGNLEGRDWLQGFVIECERQDQPVASATVELRRDGPHGLSVAPLMAASSVNVLDGVYTPLLDTGTFIRISACVKAAGEQPLASDYRPIFQGRVDRVDWSGETVQLACSDDGAWLMDTQIETSDVYGSEAGTSLETVIQEILDAWPSILGTVTLEVPVSPGWSLHEYQQDRVKVLEAIRQLAAQIGWEVAYSWDASHVFRLTLFSVDREKTTPDATIGPRQYIDLRAVALELGNIRNVVAVPYYDVNGVLQTGAVETDAASVSKLGRRYMEIAESSTSNIDTATEAEALAEAVVSDLAAPPVTHEVEMPLFWPAEFGDLYRFLANGVHYDEDQDLAVVGVRHEFREGSGVTTLACAGKVRGAYRDWLKREVRQLRRATLAYAECAARITTVTATHVTVEVTATAPGGEPVRVLLVGIVGTATRTAGAAPGTAVDSGSAWTFLRGAFGDGASQVEFKAEVTSGVSDSDFVTIAEQARDTVPLVMRARVISANADEIVVRVAVADPYPQGADSVTITYQNEGAASVSPASGQTITPAATLTEAAGTYVDFTIGRPTFNSAPGRVTFTASATGRLTDSDAVDVPAKAASPAWLDVRYTISSTQYLVYWDGDPSVQVSINGAAFATPSSSPIAVSRNAAGGAKKTYTFRAGPGDLGEYASQTVVVEPQEASPPATPAFTSAEVNSYSNPGDGGGSVEIAFAHENFPVGWTVDIEILNVTGDPITATNGGDTGITSSPATVNIALGANVSMDIRLIGRNSGGTQIAEHFFSALLP